MTTNQEGVHAAVRDYTGTARSYNEDWHAVFDGAGISAGTFNERMLAWINNALGTSYANVNAAMQAFAVDQGFANWCSMNTVSFQNEETTALLAAMSSQPSASRTAAIDEMVSALKTAGVWDKLDCLYVMAAHDSQAASLNWKNPASNALSAVGSPTFEADIGYTFGSGKYLTTAYNPATAGGQLTQNSAHMGVYSLTENLENALDVGMSDGTNGLHIGSSWTSSGKPAVISRCNSGVTIGSSATPCQSYGHVCMSRQSSANYKTYRGGAALQTITSTSAAITSLNIVIGAWNLSGSPGDYCTKTLSAAHWGSGLSDSEVLEITKALDAYYATLAAGYDVFIIAGQSNTQFGDTFAVANDASEKRFLQWLARGAAGPAIDPMDHFTLSQSVQKVGFGIPFAKSYAASSLTAGRKVLMVPCGANGTSFANNDWTNGTGTYWTQTVSRANAALAMPGATLKGLLWMQGESDALAGGTAVTNYQSRLDAALNGFRSSITGASDMPIVVGGMVPGWVGSNADRLAVQAVLADTPNRLTRCGYADPSTPSVLTATTPGDVHYSAASQRAFGSRFYNAWAAL